MKKKMTYKDFEEAYMDAVKRGTDMLCVWWTEDGDQVPLSWHPDTSYLHHKLIHEAAILMEDEEIEAVADWDMAFDDAVVLYDDVICDTVNHFYTMYLEKVGEDHDT